MRSFRFLLRLHFFSIIAFNSLFSTDWTGLAGDGEWNTAGNWNPQIVPNATDALANFPEGQGDLTAFLTTNIELGTLSTLSEDIVTVQGDYNVNIVNYITLGLEGNLILYNLDTVTFDDEAQIYFAQPNAGPGLNIVYAENINAGNLNIRGPGSCNFERIANSFTADTVNLLGGAGTSLRISFVGNLVDVNNVNISAGASLEFLNVDGDIISNIQGAGSVTVIQQQALDIQLSGNNSFSGGLILINTGVNASVTGNINSIPSVGGVSNSTSLIFNQVANGTYSGVISGTGSLTKTGAGILTLSRSNIYTGATTISGGTLSVMGAITSTSTVNAGATLRGNGSTGGIINQGTVEAGLAPGNILTVNGNYSQNNAAKMRSSLNTQNSSLLSVTGTADLDGTLLINIAPGVYPTNNSYTILSAAGGVQGKGFKEAKGLLGAAFSNVQENVEGVNIVVTYTGTNVLVKLDGGAIIIPVPVSSLEGNSYVMGSYMFSDPDFVTSNPDLNFVADAMIGLSAYGFEDALVRTSPVAAAAVPFSSYQNDLQMAVVLDKQFQKNVKNNRKKIRSKKVLEETPCSAITKTGFFIEPIGVFYNQRPTDGSDINQGQIAFLSYTYGAGLGWEQVLDNQFVVEGGIGYTHSNLDWKENFGHVNWSTIYLAPFFGWFNEKAFVNFMVMGGFNFHSSYRKVQFTGIERVAKSRYNSYDLLLRLNGGGRFYMIENFWFQPEGTLNYLTIFTDKYNEHNAGSISLQMKKNINYIMQPSIRARILKEYITKKMCYNPSVYIGWLANILLKQQTLSARFIEAPNQIFFNIQGYQKTTNQVILGAELYAERFGQFILTTNFEADLLSHFEVYIVKTKFEWLF